MSFDRAPHAPVLRARPTIAHLDADAFFAAVEQHQRPSLRGRPVLVGGVGPRSVVATASYEARQYGARSAMPMEQARRLCPPSTVVVVPRFAAYSAYSARIMAALREVTDLVEPVSIDEAFADLAAAVGPETDLAALATGIRERARELSGLPVSLGLGRSKLVAKLASEAAKPGGVRVVGADDEDPFLLDLPVRALWGVGPVSAARLDELGVRTVADLRRQPLDTLLLVAGEAGGTNLYRIARGWDDRPVSTVRERKSAGAEHTFDTDLHGRAAIAGALDPVVDAALARLERHAVAARTVVVKVRLASFTTLTRSVTLSRPTTDEGALRDAAHRALRLADVTEPVRLLGVAFHALSEHAQLMLPLGADAAEDPAVPIAAEVVGDEAVGPGAVGAASVGAASVGAESVGAEAPGAAATGPVRATAALLAPGLDVATPADGRGWVVRVGDDGRVAVRFETARTGPGYQRWVDPETEELALVEPLGPDGEPVRASPADDDA
ncbi:DNA polymerase-4 [Cellulosimicrobium aquatile]|uniref:DNA polymerase IV n=1 Tax=Cellulosimicrobium aquatile TaxID=1612203 RepID=A0A1N6QGD8_9MICO|nr:DNA polymerase IV [Cellulosimicrobium aquatile]SIQ15649.1 DNA polymerase-4 [Cellulosimicrobium aquatile]